MGSLKYSYFYIWWVFFAMKSFPSLKVRSIYGPSFSTFYFIIQLMEVVAEKYCCSIISYSIIGPKFHILLYCSFSQGHKLLSIQYSWPICPEKSD